jgi:hypothetical protein
VGVEKCFRCGKACVPVAYVRSKKSQRDLPICGKCAPKFYEGCRMPP